MIQEACFRHKHLYQNMLVREEIFYIRRTVGPRVITVKTACRVIFESVQEIKKTGCL